MKLAYKVAIGLVAISCFVIIFSVIQKPPLSEEQAFMMVFGNYDRTHKSASWEHIPFPDKEELSGHYWEEKKGIVRAIFFQPYHENGMHKVVLLTKTIPSNIPFDRHACRPLIGAAIFVRKHAHWEIEAQNQFIMYDGEYGSLPVVKLIAIGKEKVGLSLEFEHIAETDRALNIIVPYKNSIVNAHIEIIYYENFSGCEASNAIECVAYVSNIAFDKSMPGAFYGLRVKKFGTVYNDKKGKSMPVDEEVTYRLLDGHYVQIAKKAISNMEWTDIH